MPFQLAPFGDVGEAGLSAALLAALLDEHRRAALPRAELFWSYYRNALDTSGGTPASRAGASRPYRLAQERGLPARLTGARAPVWHDDRAIARREIVIENDIAWRVHAMVDFLFGRSIRLVSAAADPALRERIERALDAAWEASGGMTLLQDAALLAHVHGHVDFVVRAPESLADSFALPSAERSAHAHLDAARRLRIEVIDPSRGVPITRAADYRELDGYVIHFRRPSTRIDPATGRRGFVLVTEILSGSTRQVYEEDATPSHAGFAAGPRLVLEEPNFVHPGRVPVVHVQNVSQPFTYSGLSEIEPLIPLQDELNTRLSDRASRVTMQSFKMYLAKGIDGFDKFPVAPGTVWSTDNPDAEISAFGGDGSSPSEDAHIAQIREALDKQSGVPPLATGVVQAKVGNLSSENALRLTLSGLLARTQRKRLLYARGIEQVCGLLLSALDAAGALPTTPGDRAIRVQWPDPLPATETDALAAARAKRDLGVETDQVLGEIGYGRADVGVT
ncbi:MAG: phage portal protein [Phycisphaerales bacterium]